MQLKVLTGSNKPQRDRLSRHTILFSLHAIHRFNDNLQFSLSFCIYKKSDFSLRYVSQCVSERHADIICEIERNSSKKGDKRNQSCYLIENMKID